MLALTIGPEPRGGEPDEVLERVYHLHRDRLDREPWGYWRFDPDVPDELRAERPVLRRVHDDTHRERRERDRRSEAQAALERRRAAFLAGLEEGRASPSEGGT